MSIRITLKRKLKSSVAAFMALMALFAAMPVSQYTLYAERDYEAEIEKLNQEIEDAKERQKKRNELISKYMDDVSKQEDLQRLVQEQVNEIEAKVEKQNSLIDAKQNDIERKIAGLDHLQAQIADRKEAIKDKRAVIKQKEQKNSENIKQFGEIVKSMYMNETVDPLSQLMGSSDFFDLLVRTEMLENVGEKNLEFMNGLLAEIDNQKNLISQLEGDILKLEGDIAQAEAEKLRLEEDKIKLNREYGLLEQEMNAEYNELYGVISQKELLKNSISIKKRENAEDAELQEEANRMVAELIRQQARANQGLPIFSSDDFLWPLNSNFQMITTYFGYDAWRGGNHYGIDVGNGGIGGANIYAVQSGTVLLAYNNGGWNGGYGNYVVIDHGDGITTLYAHAKTGSVKVGKGQTVDRGQVIASVGSTGFSTGNHLHFEVRIDGVAVNPFNYKYQNKD
ncbi:MAG: peptidoglycan DD-metalloendopeptidase family protein [Eubacterium sp.]|jgi:murein DD-endopeptidase MepM/ murein hydrolase activator NlpD|nr:peptidoglycan DD-metalloendopeptidase family protein [Eubacterium sp.]